MQNSLFKGAAFGVMAVAASAVLAAGEARAEAVALIMEIDGNVQPELYPYSEVELGTEITLGPETTMRFAYYADCLDVTVTGGKVVFDDFGYTLQGARVDNEADWICPTEISPSAAGTDATNIPGGIVLRGVPKPNENTRAPERTIAVVGERSGEAAMVKIMRDGDVAAGFTVEGRPAFQVPGEIVKAGHEYRVIVSGADGVELLNQPLDAADLGPLTLIRLD